MALVLQWRLWGTKTFVLGLIMLQLIFLQKILVHSAHCNSFKSRHSPTNHESLKAGNLILQRNLPHHNWLMSSYLYNPITFLFLVPGRAASHLYNQVLPYIIISILMLEFHYVILFIKLCWTWNHIFCQISVNVLIITSSILDLSVYYCFIHTFCNFISVICLHY